MLLQAAEYRKELMGSNGKIYSIIKYQLIFKYKTINMRKNINGIFKEGRLFCLLHFKSPYNLARGENNALLTI